jgi:hypothetical protein
VITSPVHVRREMYRGSDPKKRKKAQEHNALAVRIEDVANRLINEQTDAICSYLHHDIARELGEDPDMVRRLGFSIDGGHNGFTAVRPGITQAELDQAMGRSPKEP